MATTTASAPAATMMVNLRLLRGLPCLDVPGGPPGPPWPGGGAGGRK
jgi:hypothetical protein